MRKEKKQARERVRDRKKRDQEATHTTCRMGRRRYVIASPEGGSSRQRARRQIRADSFAEKTGSGDRKFIGHFLSAGDGTQRVGRVAGVALFFMPVSRLNANKTVIDAMRVRVWKNTGRIVPSNHGIIFAYR